MNIGASCCCSQRCHVTWLAGLACAVILVVLASGMAGRAVGEPRTRLQAGVLECRGDGGWGAIIASEKT